MNIDAELEALSAAVGATLCKRQLMLASAESCTGGWVAAVITATGGSSGWFERGFITYSNAAKQEMLGVPAATLVAHGAVSEPTATAMAAGTLAHSRADIALAVTGIAGPTGGSPSKPLGTVCFAWSSRKGWSAVETRQFAGDRQSVRRKALIHVLSRLLEEDFVPR
jgi:nicotinamide-nucleotide amidase